MARKIVIGDIHGALRALKQLLERVGLQGTDELIFLGDYVDGWSESAQVIDHLILLEKNYSCLFLRGNHDAWAETWLKTGQAEPAEWVRNGGQETMNSYNGYSDAQKEAHLRFLGKMPFYAIDADNRLFVHAGFSSTQGPPKEHFDSNFFWDRTLWELALAVDKDLSPHSPFYPKRLKLFREIFIGHTPTTNYDIAVPMHAHNVWNADTGAAFKGAIAALDVETKTYWQSEPAWTFYPGENGRNR